MQTEITAKRRRVSFEADPSLVVETAVKTQKEVCCPAMDLVSVKARLLERVPTLVLRGTQSNDARIVAKSLTQLANVFLASPELRREAYETGAPGIFVIVMKKWLSNDSIQREACRCLQNIVLQFPEAVKSFAKVGAVESVMSALYNFPNSLDIQKNALGALNNFFAIKQEKKLMATTAMRFVRELGGVELLVRAMKDFPEDCKIQKRCCGILYSQCMLCDCKATIRELGVVGTVAAAIQMHRGDSGVQIVASAFLNAML
jgi:hypothetical protein